MWCNVFLPPAPKCVDFKCTHRLFAVPHNYQMSSAEEQTTVIRQSIIYGFFCLHLHLFSFTLLRGVWEDLKSTEAKSEVVISFGSHFSLPSNKFFFSCLLPDVHLSVGMETGKKNCWRKICSAGSHLTQRPARKKLWSAPAVLLTVPFVVTCQPLWNDG